MRETWYSPAPPGTWNCCYDGNDGVLGSSPGAAVVSGQQNVFWEGTDHNLWEDFFANSSWQGARNLTPNYGGVASAPAVGSIYSTGAQFVFWRASNGDLTEAWWSGGQWNGPRDFGGAYSNFGDAPTVAVDTAGNQYVFWIGTDSALWETMYVASPGYWTPEFQPLPSPQPLLGSRPTAVLNSPQEEVFWRGGDGNLWEAFYAGGWYGPSPVAGVSDPLATSPSAAMMSTQTNVFWWSGYAGLKEAFYTGNWNGPDIVEQPNWSSGASETGVWTFSCDGFPYTYSYSATGSAQYVGHYYDSTGWWDVGDTDSQSLYVTDGNAWWLPCNMALKPHIEYYQNGSSWVASAVRSK